MNYNRRYRREFVFKLCLNGCEVMPCRRRGRGGSHVDPQRYIVAGRIGSKALAGPLNNPKRPKAQGIVLGTSTRALKHYLLMIAAALHCAQKRHHQGLFYAITSLGDTPRVD